MNLLSVGKNAHEDQITRQRSYALSIQSVCAPSLKWNERKLAVDAG